MHKWKLVAVLLAAFVYTVNARPTFDVLYKIARDLENELISDSHGPRRDSYRTHQPGYGPPSGNGYYPPHSHGRPPNGGYPAPYPSPYPAPYPAAYPSPYPPNVANPTSSQYPGPYPAAHIPQGPYSSNNYLQNPSNHYDEQYPGQLGSNGFGVVSGSNSYAYGSNSGYKRKGY